MTQYQVTVRDFARRTRANLRTIELLAEREKDKYFEVTQLVNSAIGLLMFPQQEFFGSLPETKLDELARQGWPMPILEYGQERTTTLRELAKNIRNSFAHFNVDFKPCGGKIEGIYLWNRPNEKSKPNWICYISISSLRTLFDKIAREAEKLSLHPYCELRINDVRTEVGLPTLGNRD
jgi:hypothetical protein